MVDKNKIKEEILDQISGWVYEKGEGSNNEIVADIIAEQMMISRQYAIDCNKMKILDESKGIFVDLHGANEGIARNELDDEEYIATIKLGATGKPNRGDMNTMIKSLASAFNVNFSDVKILENDISPQLKTKQIWVEVNSLKNYDLLTMVKKIKASGIIVLAAVLKQKDTFILTDNQSLGDEVGFDNGKFWSIRPFLKGSFTLDDPLLGLDRGKLGY